MKRIAVICAALLLVSAVAEAGTKKEAKPNQGPSGPIPVALLDGGRHLDFIRFLSSEQELHLKRGFFNRVLDIVAGSPEWRKLVRPYSITTDSHGRILITDPGALAVHIFDLDKKKYTVIQGGKGNTFQSPIGIAVDSDDNIYVTDSRLGMIFVFDARGKSRGILGRLKGGEGFYKRPTGIAFDKVAHQLYVTDTLRNRVYVTDLEGRIVREFGSPGTAAGQFNFPTEVVVHGDDVFVVDALNFRVQMFDREGKFHSEFGSIGEQAGRLFRAKGLGVDSEGHIYLVDAAMETVQIFNRIGQLLYTFGHDGNGVAGFQLPAGLWIDGKDRIYVADSYNHRIQVFQFNGPGKNAGGGTD